MSKDIRSFFVKKDKPSNSNGSDSFTKSKKRPPRVIESDSDDDAFILGKSSPKKLKESKSASKKSSFKTKEKTQKETHVTAESFFGTSPVKQKHQNIKKVDKSEKSGERRISHEGKNQKSKIRKKGNRESSLEKSFSIENDDGFDETLLQINENELERLTGKKNKTTPTKNDPEQINKTDEISKTVIKKTPVKEINQERNAQTPKSVESKSERNSLIDSEKKRKNAESYQRYLNRSGPKHPGSKEIPKGTPTCLQGMAFVISGVLDSMERDEAVELIQKCGGRVTSSISKKTDFIVIGEEAGQSKLEKANKLGTKKLNEDGLLDLIRSKSVIDYESGSSQDNFIEGTPKKSESKYFKSDNKKKRALDSEESPDNRQKKSRKVVEIEAPKFIKKTKLDLEMKNSSGYESVTESQTSPSEPFKESPPIMKSTPVQSLWVDKYKPVSTKNIIGQGGDKSNVKKLIYWLEHWFENNIESNVKKPKPAPWQSNDGSAFKAALLSGPPGVGKTTSVQLVCKELGFDTVEFNASDTRSKRLLQEEVSELLQTKSILSFCQGAEKMKSKHVLVMDEVDGMAGNEDRGGIQELIQIIKRTKVPIICMCNDRSLPKIRSLANNCFDLRYNKPRIEQIKGAMMSVCFKEKLKISNEALEEIIINTNQDVRQVLHNLSLWAVGNKSINTEEAKKEAVKAKKPLNLGPWDVVRKVFSVSEHSAMTFREKEELFFQDYSLGPLFVQDSYIRVKPSKAKNDKKQTLNLLSKAADALLLGDIVERAIRSENAWGLLPVQAIFSSVLPGHFMEGHMQGQIQFPVWFGKNSKRSRYQRILQELQTHMRLSISGSGQAVNLDYLHTLRDSIIRPLMRNGMEGIEEVLSFMNDYNLTKDDVDNIMELSLWPGGKDYYGSVDSKVKAALTRAYNKEGKPVPFAVSSNVKKGKAVDNEYEMENETVEENPEDEDDIDLDAMIKKGKTRTKPANEEKKVKEKKEKAQKEKAPKEGNKGKKKR